MFDLDPSFEDSSAWEESLEKIESDGKFKFPISFHDPIESVDQIPNLLSLRPPVKREEKAKVVELKKKNKSKNKKSLF